MENHCRSKIQQEACENEAQEIYASQTHLRHVYENFLTLTTTTLFSYIKYTNIQISHHLQTARLIIKITISSFVIGLKKSYFQLIRLPSCYRTVCYWIVCYWAVCYRIV